MLGIPTRSDVADKKYRESVIAERVRGSLDGFNWPTSTVFIHNHVVGSKRGDLDPSFVLAHYNGRINLFRENLERAASLGLILPKGESTSTSHPNEQPYFDGRANKSKIRKRRRGIEERLVVVKPVKKWFKHDERDGFKIKFDPRELAEYELTGYEAALREAFESSTNPKTQLKRMRKVIEEFDDSAHKELLSHGLIDSFKPEWPFSIEGRKGTEAYKLKQEYQEVADRSDIYLRFDEFYVVIRKQNGETCIPSQVLLDQTNPLTSGDLWHRQFIRDEVSALVGAKKGFVFNGIEYHPQSSTEGRIDTYTASGSVSSELVNILGVQTINEQMIIPTEWAIKEIDLVRRHREGDLTATESFLEKYSGWGSSEHASTKKDKLEHVNYVLKGRTMLE
jgi:hypothetical protein